MKIYYVKFIVSNGITEKQGLQPVAASSEVQALECANKFLEKETLEIGCTYTILGVKHVED